VNAAIATVTLTFDQELYIPNPIRCPSVGCNNQTVQPCGCDYTGTKICGEAVQDLNPFGNFWKEIFLIDCN
jgi:hypothetical protein